MTVLGSVARWVAGLDYDDIPERVREVARHQAASVLGAVFAGARCDGGRAVIEAVRGWEQSGPCAAYPGGEGRPFQAALLQNCSLSMALDYDDYLFLGHTGHSAVPVPLAVGEMNGADGRTLLVAQVAANEVAGRLGGSVVLGPHNGQMWAHIHLLGAAAAASRVLGLSEEETANAFGIAMAEPVYALFPGFMGPQSKLLTAAVPSITGATAAFLAQRGMTGSQSIIEDDEGFWRHFSFLPLPLMFTGLGRAWVTDTIAYKPYPGCAYVDTAVDATLALLSSFSEERGEALEPSEVRGVSVRASLLTIAMDAMSSGYMDPARLSPTNINFSLSVSLAITLLAGRLSGMELTDGFLADNRESILALASKVELEHDAALTTAFLRSLDETIDLGSLVSAIDFRDFLRARRRLGEHLSRVGTMGPREAFDALRALSPLDRAFLRRLVSPRAIFRTVPGYDLGDHHLEELLMPFGASVSVTLKDGTVLEGEKLLPRGAPGDPDRFEVPREKFLRESDGFLDAGSARAALDALLTIEDSGPERLRAALQSE